MDRATWPKTYVKRSRGHRKEWDCDLVLLAMGFTGSETTIADRLNLELDTRTNIKASIENYKTNIPGILPGDRRRGQSLIVLGHF